MSDKYQSEMKAFGGGGGYSLQVCSRSLPILAPSSVRELPLVALVYPQFFSISHPVSSSKFPPTPNERFTQCCKCGAYSMSTWTRRDRFPSFLPSKLSFILPLIFSLSRYPFFFSVSFVPTGSHLLCIILPLFVFPFFYYFIISSLTPCFNFFILFCHILRLWGCSYFFTLPLFIYYFLPLFYFCVGVFLSLFILSHSSMVRASIIFSSLPLFLHSLLSSLLLVYYVTFILCVSLSLFHFASFFLCVVLSFLCLF